MIKKFFILLSLAITLFAGQLAFAATDDAAKTEARLGGARGLLSGVSDACYDAGNCSLCDVIAVINTVIKVVLGIVGSVALGAFIWAGINIMFRGASAARWTKAKDTMKYAIIGLLLVFFSYSLVNLGLNILVGTSTVGQGNVDYGNIANIFGQGWANICAGNK